MADLAWNHDDSMIASVGLDRKIYIWDGYTFGQCLSIFSTRPSLDFPSLTIKIISFLSRLAEKDRRSPRIR